MSKSSVQASANLIEQLKTLTGVLYEAASGDEETRDALMLPAAEGFLEISTQAQADGFRGLPELLRMLGDGLYRQAHNGVTIGDDEVIQIAGFAPSALAYVRGELAPDQASQLLSHLIGLPFMPVASQRVRDLIEQRLRTCCPTPEGASEDSSEANETVVAIESSVTLDSTDSGESWASDQASDSQTDSENRPSEVEAALDPEQTDKAEAELEILLGEWNESLGVGENQSSDEPSLILGDEPSMSLGDELAMTLGDEPAMSLGDESIDNAMVVDGDALQVTGLEQNADEAAGDIWIAPEELSMATEAIEQRLLPVLSELADPNLTSDERAIRLQDYEFQLGLLGNALEILSLPQLKDTLDRISATVAIAATEPEAFGDAGANALMQWQLAQLTVLQDPSLEDTRALLRESLQDPQLNTGIDDERWAEIEAELDRIRIGLDPAYKASRKQIAEPGDIELRIAPDVLPAVRDGMLRELPNNTHTLSESVRRLVKSGHPEDIDQARRVAHTLKGDANIVGVKGIANTAHALEDILVELAKKPGVPGRELGDALLQATDAIEAMADHVLGRGPAPDDALDTLQGVMNWANALVLGEGAPVSAPAATPARAEAPAAGEGAAAEAEATVPTLQIPVPLLDELLRLSSETIVLARQMEERFKFIGQSHHQIASQNGIAKTLVNELDEIVALRGAALQSARTVQGAEVDPLELDEYNELHMVSRRLIETNEDVHQFSQSIEFSMSQMAELSATQERIQNELQDAVLRTRMVPVKNIVPRLQRVVRQTARTVLKEAELVVDGEAVLVDSDMLDRLVEPLSHALRNAVDHGIESPEERAAKNKPETGVVKLHVWRKAGVVHFELHDDGKGLNYPRIRDKAVEAGLLASDAEPTPDELARVILMPGFSTKEDVTQVSGRGIGMDVVYRRIQELKGSLQVHSEPGAGTRLKFDLPAQLNAAHVALVRAGQSRVALVSSGVEQFLPVPLEAIQLDTQGMFIEMGADRVPLLTIENIALAEPLVRPQTNVVGAMVRDDRGRRSMVIVSDVDEMRNVIVKSFGPHVAVIPGVRGATILGNGGLAPVVDLSALLSDMAERRGGMASARVLEAHEVAAPRCVVVDDSLSVRRALEQLMQDAGYEVRTAIDGIDALEVISQRIPAVVLVDLEMPRMNGLELTTFLRANTQTKHIPIVMITSRTSDKHIELAQQAGVSQILGKPYSDDELLNLVRDLISAGKPTQVAA